MMSRAKQFLEQHDLIENIKKFLFTEDGYDTWEEFVDHQEIGNCQGIAASIVRKFPQAKKVFGEIDVEESYVDDKGEEQDKVTHHWIKIGKDTYDFSKGTLKDYITFDDIYDPEIEDVSIYHPISGG